MTPEREAQARKIAEGRDGEWSSKVSNEVLRDVLAELDALRREHRQFLADLGSIVAGMPVEPAEALRRVEELVRLRETGGSS